MSASTNNGIRQLRARWDALTPSQRRVGLVVLSVFASVLLAGFLWLPAARENDRLQARIPVLTRGLDAMKSDAADIAKLRQSSGTPSPTAKPPIEEAALRAHFGDAFTVTRASSSTFRVTTQRSTYRDWWDKVIEANAKFGLRIVRVKLGSTNPPSRDVTGEVELSSMIAAPNTPSAKP